MKLIPNCVPSLNGNEAKYLSECVKTGWVSSVGPYVDRFEQMFAEYHGVESAAAVSSGTAAIHVGLIALGVQAGDLVLCPSLTFVGTVNPIRYCGAQPIFLDSEETTLNLDPSCLEDYLRNETERTTDGLIHRRSGRRVSGLIVVHLYGTPADMDSILELAHEYGLPVLEDAAESLGALYKGRRVGTMGDVGFFSFNGNKVVTTGGGGMIISRNPGHIRFSKHISTQARSDSFDFVHDYVGYNYRLSNLCAAVGIAQMEQLDLFIEQKRRHADLYKTLFARDGKWSIVDEPRESFGTFWMVLARCQTELKQPLLEQLREWSNRGIGVRPIWHPVHLMPLYSKAIVHGGKVCQRLHQTLFCLPSSAGLTDEEIERVVAQLDGI